MSMLSLTARHPAWAERLDFKRFIFGGAVGPCTHNRVHWPNGRSWGEPETPRWRG